MDLEKIVHDFLGSAYVAKHPRSVTMRWDVPEGALYLKYSREDLSNEARVLGEANFEIAGIRPVELVGYHAPSNVLLTRFSAGESAFNVMWNGAAWWRRVYPHARAARSRNAELLPRLAEWLARFHALEPVDEGERGGARAFFRQTLLGKARSIVDSGSDVLDERGLQRLGGWTDENLDDAAWDTLSMVRIHGDLGLNNMLMANGSVRILDFADTRHGFALEDIARPYSGMWELAECGRLDPDALADALRRTGTSHGTLIPAPDSAPWLMMRTWNAVVRVAERCLVWDRLGRSGRRLSRVLSEAQLGFLRRHVPGFAGRE